MSRQLSRADWVAAGLAELRSGGIEAVRVEPLAARLGVTKGSFYHHFDNRRDLHLALLAAWEQRGTQDIIDTVKVVSGEPGEQLRALAHRVIPTNAASDGIEEAIRAWAGHDPQVGVVVRRVDDQRLAFVAGLLRECGLDRRLAMRRAKLFYRVMVGEWIWTSGGGPASTRSEIDEVVELVLGGG